MGLHSRIPNVVPIVFGINLNWRSPGPELAKAVTSAMVNLASASVPKYATRALFLRETAHTLKQIVSWAAWETVEERNLPQRNKDVRGEYEEHDNEELDVGSNSLSDECAISDGRSSCEQVPFGALTKSMGGVNIGERYLIFERTLELFG